VKRDAQSERKVFCVSIGPPSNLAKRIAPDLSQLGSGGCSNCTGVALAAVCALPTRFSAVASTNKIAITRHIVPILFAQAVMLMNLINLPGRIFYLIPRREVSNRDHFCSSAYYELSKIKRAFIGNPFYEPRINGRTESAISEWENQPRTFAGGV
jgi:hypothetical protein